MQDGGHAGNVCESYPLDYFMSKMRPISEKFYPTNWKSLLFWTESVSDVMGSFRVILIATYLIQT